MKKRLDILLFERGLSPSRERARAAIMSGDVYVSGQRADKPGMSFSEDSEIELRQDPIGFVSRGGLKLQKALDVFGVLPEGRNVLDCGASSGGFTDCLLKRGAKRVWAIDVGYGQLAWSLRNDSRVVCMERFNVRGLTKEHVGEPVDLAVCDLSFISLRLILPVLAQVLEASCELVCLVKPQFEAGREAVGKGGVIREPKVHAAVLEEFGRNARDAGFAVNAVTFSPVKGPKGNIEFLAHLIRPGECAEIDFGELVKETHRQMTVNR